MRGGRYANVKKVREDGYTFDSGRELERYRELKLLARAGVIAGLEVHPAYHLLGANGEPLMMRSGRYPNGRRMRYIGDFEYLDTATGEKIIEDVKMQSGHRTDVYRIKKAIMEGMGFRVLET